MSSSVIAPLPRLVLALVLMLLAPSPAGARARPGASAHIQRLNKKAMDEYDMLEFEAARAALESALGVARAAGISGGPALTETYLNLGVVHGAGLNDRAGAIKYFTAALKTSPDAGLNPARATPALEEMFRSVQRMMLRGSGGRKALRHTPVTEATAGKDLPIEAEVSAPGVARVVLHFRSASAEGFQQLEMMQGAGGLRAAVIPARAVHGGWIQYYIEAEDEFGDRVLGTGDAARPYTVSLRGGDGSKGSAAGSGPGGSSGKTISVGLMAGVGFGVLNGGASAHKHPYGSGTSGAEVIKAVDISAGGAVAPFHVAPEVSYHLNPRWHLCLLGRIQLINALSDGLSSRISLLGQLRAKRIFGAGALRYYLAFGAGAGQVRYRVGLEDYDRDPSTPNDIVDARVAGIGAFGAGGGIQYMVWRFVGLAAELNALILVPEFAANLDVNAGLLLTF